MKYCLTPLFAVFLFFSPLFGQLDESKQEEIENKEDKQAIKLKVHYGTASYYADKFNGRKTANGEIYDSNKLTAACNILPLGSVIRVTNLKNNKTIVVKVNDRLHPRMTRIVDLSRTAAEKLGYINRGLTNVKVEVIKMQKK